jgi:hypothetical protein
MRKRRCTDMILGVTFFTPLSKSKLSKVFYIQIFPLWYIVIFSLLLFSFHVSFKKLVRSVIPCVSLAIGLLRFEKMGNLLISLDLLLMDLIIIFPSNLHKLWKCSRAWKEYARSALESSPFKNKNWKLYLCILSFS